MMRRLWLVWIVLLCAPVWAVPVKQVRGAGEGGTCTVAAVGDAIITRRVMQFDREGDPRFHRLVKVIRAADAATLNLELSLFDAARFRGWPEVENGGNWEAGPPQGARELEKMGFHLFARANNHATDYGVEGMRETDRLLDRLGIAHAGTGENLEQAGRPCYYDTRRGRVALISVATTFTPMSRAGSGRAGMNGRPGLNALRVLTRHEADEATLRQLRAMASVYGRSSVYGAAPGPSDAWVRVFGTRVYPGPKSAVIETLHAGDSERILHEIRNASRMADIVVMSIHSHEPDNLQTTPPAWLVKFGHDCLEQGADAVVAHGPHQLRGIEIYQGKPIFYSLGNFIFQNQTIDPLPADAYESLDLPPGALASDYYTRRFEGDRKGFPTRPQVYESVVAVSTFQGHRLAALTLQPIEMGREAPWSQRGTPRIAEGVQARQIIERLSGLSAPFGTTIRFRDGVGVWRAGR